MAAYFRLIVVVVVLLPVTFVLLPVQYLAIIFFPLLSRKIPLYWHKLALLLVGTKVFVRGQMPVEKPLLIVANHLSWSDILVLGSVMELCFIAKDEVKSWPGISVLARLQRTVFVNRGKRSDSGKQVNSVAARLLEGDRMVLFAEGTTCSGHRISPFKSALFGAAQYALKESHLESVTVQPVAIAYTHLFGMPLGRYHQTQASWPGDIPLGPHLINFLKKGAYDVEVVFGEPLMITSKTSRREVARITQNRVSAMFQKAMRGDYINGVDTGRIEK